MSTAVQGPILAASAQQTTIGMGLISWVDINNILVDDSVSYASMQLTHGSPQSERVFSQGYGFTVPAIATIDGIQFSYIAYVSQQEGGAHLNQLVYKNGAPISYETFNFPTTDPVSYVVGGESELFGQSWSPAADINDGGLGLGLYGGLSTLDPVEFFVTAFYATVYYTLASTPSNGGVTAFERIGLYPMSDGKLYAFDPNAGFDDPVDGSSYFWRIEEIAVGRKPTISRVFVTYMDLGQVTTVWTLTAVQDDQTVVTAITTKVLGNVNPTRRLMTAEIDLNLSGMDFQLSMTRAAGAGPISIAKIKIIGRVETDSYT